MLQASAAKQIAYQFNRKQELAARQLAEVNSVVESACNRGNYSVQVADLYPNVEEQLINMYGYKVEHKGTIICISWK